MSFPSSHSRRGQQRFPCEIDAVIYKSMLRPRVGSATILDIGMGGAKIICAEALSVGESYQLKFSHQDQKFSFDCRIAWEKREKRRSYGVTFAIGKRKEESLKILIDALRQGARAPSSGLDLKNYWDA